jgi:hypothetical protein
MLDLKISRLALAIENSSGHEHRIQPIALRAANMLAENLSAWQAAGGHSLRSVYLDAISAPALSVDLDRTSDEQAARQIASAWFEAFALHLKG